MFKGDIKNQFNIDITEKQLNQFNIYYEYLVEYNKMVNLTRITEKEEVFYKHFFDSITLIESLDVEKINSLCDMGAGAGFPSIPLKIVFPHLKITIIDSLGKRITFLNQLLKKLHIDDIFLVYDRIENYAQLNHEKFDVVTARALGKLPLILEMGLPMTKIGGFFVAYKSNKYKTEVEQSKQAFKTLGGELTKVVNIKLPLTYGDRTHLVVEKIKTTPKMYPRSFALIKNKTL